MVTQHRVVKECPGESILSWPKSSLRFFCNTWETQMNVLADPGSSLIIQMKPNPVRIVPFQVTNAHNSIRTLQEKESDSLLFLPFQRNAWTPGIIVQAALPCPQVPCCFHSLCGLSWLPVPCPVSHQAGTYFLTTGTQSWL